MTAGPPPFVALSPGGLDPTRARDFARSAQPAIAAGLRGLCLREPGLLDGALLELASAQASAPARSSPVWLCLHDRIHLARAAGANAIHLGFRSLPPTTARQILGKGITIGFSAHETDDPSTWQGADYLFYGPVLDTPSKRGLIKPTGFENLRRAVLATDLPIWAIGGLRPEHVEPALAAGAKGICALSGVFGADDPATATRAYLAAFQEAGRQA